MSVKHEKSIKKPTLGKMGYQLETTALISIDNYNAFRIRCIMLILENLHYYYFKISLISKHKTRLSRLLLTVKLS
ncbi:hypothetical protein ENC21_12645 [Acinetobacter indicus]|nr:hypothetical protein ENC21_12645 [Acinetobacter indicus]